MQDDPVYEAAETEAEQIERRRAAYDDMLTAQDIELPDTADEFWNLREELLAQATDQLHDVEAELLAVLDRTKTPYATYLNGTPLERRILNQTCFKQLFIGEDNEVLGVTLPDPDLSFDAETGHYRFGAIDWDELKRVISGNGPANAERIARRRAARDDNAWVTEAATAYAAKHAS